MLFALLIGWYLQPQNSSPKQIIGQISLIPALTKVTDWHTEVLPEVTKFMKVIKFTKRQESHDIHKIHEIHKSHEIQKSHEIHKKSERSKK